MIQMKTENSSTKKEYPKKRFLGRYEGKASFSEQDNSKISTEEFLGIDDGEKHIQNI